MKVYSNIPEVLKQLERIKAAAGASAAGEGGIQDAIVGAMNAGRALMVRRIFNNGEDATGKPLGPYKSKPYKKKRVDAGRQVNKKDLEFSGSVRRSIETVTGDGNKVTIAITNVENAKIARYQEQQLRAPIFIFSQAEFDTVKEQGNRLITEVIKSKMQ